MAEQSSGLCACRPLESQRQAHLTQPADQVELSAHGTWRTPRHLDAHARFQPRSGHREFMTTRPGVAARNVIRILTSA
jgi:hypothetical protein